MNIYIKNAFINNMYNLKGSPASVELVENIDDIEYMLYQTKKLKLPISVFLKKTNTENKFKVRYFIEDGEEPICGHGTIVATQFLLDNNLIDQNHIQNIEYIPMFSNNKYGNNKQNNICAKINKDSISIFISTIKTKIITEEKKQEIIKSISEINHEYFEILNIVEGEFDYTVEIKKSKFAQNKKISSLEVIKNITPNFDLIENILLSNNKLCRGIDVLIRNDDIKDKISCDYFTRIFLPLGASPEFKEDPACGSGSAYISRYLTEYNSKLIGKKLNFYQASNSGAFISTKTLDNNIIEVMGKVK